MFWYTAGTRSRTSRNRCNACREQTFDVMFDDDGAVWLAGIPRRGDFERLKARLGNGRCRMHGGKAPGAARGNRNAFKHGRYTAEAIAERRDLMALLRGMKGLVEQVEGEE